MSHAAPVVAVTGNIASGKSTVARLLEALGAHRVDADQLARLVVAPGSPALAAIAARWPTTIAADGSLDRPALRRIVFRDAGERAALEAITHPAIAALRDGAIAAARHAGATLIVYDVPLLFEAGLEHSVDRIVLVDAPMALRRERLERERGLSREEAEQAIAAQMPASHKRARAHHIIENAGSEADLAEAVRRLWATLAPLRSLD